MKKEINVKIEGKEEKEVSMDIFDVLSLAGGLALFLLGMNLMGGAIEKKAGGRLKTILESLTNSPIKGLLLGLLVTAVIQSSSATTVMVVGFVSAGVMTLHQSIYIIMGANIGTTVTAWILSLAGIEGTSLLVQLCKPSSFTPVLALIGICVFLVAQGLPALSWTFLTEPPRNMMTEGGILPCIIGTALLALGSLCLSFPLGVGSAVGEGVGVA